MIHCTILVKGKRSRKERAVIRELQDVASDLQLSVDMGALVMVLREQLPSLEPDEHWKLIDELPLVCPGQAIRRRRTGEEKVEYTGVALLNVKNLASEADAEAVKEAAEALPMTLLATIGASGRSVKILVRGLLTDGTLPEDDEQVEAFHRQLYNVACRTYAALLPSPLASVDVSPRDTFRWTFDRKLVFNPDAAPFRIKGESLRARRMEPDASEQPYGPGTVTPKSYELWQRRFSKAVLKALDELRPEPEQAGQSVDEETLLSVAAREAHALGVPAEEAVARACHHFHWYQMPPSQVRSIVEGVYDELSRQSVSPEKNSMRDLTFRLQEWMQGRYDLRYNEMSNGVEWRSNTSYGHKFRPLDSRVMNTMIQEANERGLEIFDRDMKRYLGSTRVREYNVVRSYLRGVEGKWDGNHDYIKDLADRIPTRNAQWGEWFHTWFLGMVAQWLGWNRNYGNAVVPMLVGAQGCGKSTYGQMLLPPELRDVGYKELVDFSSKQEAERLLTNSLLVNLDEFNQISEKTQQGFLKNLLQKSSVKGRRPYSSTIVNLPRYASFIATTNMGGVLADPSGSRRFIIVEIAEGQHIDTATPVPYEAVYAQAVAELSAGRRYWFTPDESRQLEAQNLSSEAQRPVVQHFMETFELARKSDGDALCMTTHELLQEVRRTTGFKPDGNADVFLGRWLTGEVRAGRLEMRRTGGRRQYFVRKVRKVGIHI